MHAGMLFFEEVRLSYLRQEVCQNGKQLITNKKAFSILSVFGHPVRFREQRTCVFERFFVYLPAEKRRLATFTQSCAFMTTDRIITDEELGRLTVRVNARARRLTFRAKEDGIHVTVPPRTSLAEVERAIEELRPRLLEAKRKRARKLIDLDYHIDTEFFKLTLVGGQRERFLSRSELGEMQIICPPNADFTDENLQTWLRKVIEEALRRNAKIILPPRLYMLSMQHNLPYRSVKINSSSGRWGSCSAQGNINLSYYLVLLPRHLIDYVLLHELAHTREMSHGEGFWTLLDKLTDGKAQALREELKGYRTEI